MSCPDVPSFSEDRLMSAEITSGTSADTMSAGQRTRLVATSFLALFSIVGLVLYGLPMYYDFFMTELKLSYKQVTYGNAFSKVAVAVVFGFIAGRLVDRIGPRRPMIFGIVCMGVALVGLSSVHSFGPFLLFWVFNALAYLFGGPLPNQVLLSQQFKQARGKAMGIAYVGIGVGFFFVPQISKLLTGWVGWRDALRILAAIAVAVALPLVLFLREGGAPAAPKAAAPKPAGPPLSEVLRSRAFYLLALGSMASIGAVGGTNQHLKLLLTKNLMWSQDAAFNLLSWVAGASLIGRFGAGWLADRIGAKRVMLLVYALVTCATLILVAGPSGPGLYAFAVVFGLGLGGEYLIIPLMAGELFGTAILGRVMGIVLAADGIAEATFPILAGHLRDVTGSYTLSWKVLTALAAVGALAILMLPMPGRPTRAATTATAPSPQ
jgi:MFS family permease